MVSDSVYIVFLDKCQPVTFFKVIYSPQTADAVAAFVLLCWLVTSSVAIIFLHFPPYWNDAHLFSLFCFFEFRLIVPLKSIQDLGSLFSLFTCCLFLMLKGIIIIFSVSWVSAQLKLKFMHFSFVTPLFEFFWNGKIDNLRLDITTAHLYVFAHTKCLKKALNFSPVSMGFFLCLLKPLLCSSGSKLSGSERLSQEKWILTAPKEIIGTFSYA